MRVIADLMRRLAKWRFRVRGLATIADIKQSEFANILAALEADGWKIYARYFGVDAGIDYDCIRLKRERIKLKCEWDNWDEWSIEGPDLVVCELAGRFQLSAKSQWRWAVWEQMSPQPSAEQHSSKQ